VVRKSKRLQEQFDVRQIDKPVPIKIEFVAIDNRRNRRPPEAFNHVLPRNADRYLLCLANTLLALVGGAWVRVPARRAVGFGKLRALTGFRNAGAGIVAEVSGTLDDPNGSAISGYTAITDGTLIAVIA